MAEEPKEQKPEEVSTEPETRTQSLADRVKAALPGRLRGKMRRQHILIGIAILIFAGIILPACVFSGVLAKSRGKARAEKIPLYRTHINEAEKFTQKHVVRETFAKAFECLQLAVEKADTHEAKGEAGLAMGKLLVQYARREPKPHALMAKQYLEAVLDMEKRPEIRIQACIALIEAAYLLKDEATMARASDEALAVATDKDDRARILLVRMDIFMEKGKWNDMQKLLAMSAPYRSDPRWQYEFELKNAIADEQTLLQDDWFLERQEYMESGRSGATARVLDTDSLRNDLLLKAIGQFSSLANSGIDRLVSESLFRMARLYFNEGQYDNAEKFFDEFFTHEPTGHQAETLLMLTTIARIQGRMQDAEAMIASFLYSFSWDDTAAREFLMIVNEGIKNGRFEQALNLIEKYINMPQASQELSELLYKAGQLAGILGRYDLAEEYLRKVVERNERNDLIIDAMLDLAETRFKRNDAEGARHWLLAYLNRFPYDARQGDALFELLKLSLQKKTALCEVINIAATAADECPEDSRAIEALLLAAKRLEAIGLHDLAEKQYNKIALLYFGSKANGQTAELDKSKNAMVLQSILGNARCLINAGQHENANLLLRKLCNSLQPGDLQSEAAYLWALLSMDEDQKKETIRRLKLATGKTAGPETAIRAAIKLEELKADEQYSDETIISIVKKLSKLPPDAHGEFIRQTFMTCFNQLLQKRDVENMQKIFEIAFDGDISREFMWQELSLRIGRVILEDKGVVPFIAYMEKTKKMLASAGIEMNENAISMLQQARDIEKYKREIAGHLQTKL